MRDMEDSRVRVKWAEISGQEIAGVERDTKSLSSSLRELEPRV
jgi:hypothetical protein